MIDEEIKDRLLKLIADLRNRPAVLYSGKADYLNTKIFIEGFFHGKFSDYTLFNDIRIWLNQKKNIKLDISWTDYPMHFMNESNDEEKRKELLVILEEYLIQN